MSSDADLRSMVATFRRCSSMGRCGSPARATSCSSARRRRWIAVSRTLRLPGSGPASERIFPTGMQDPFALLSLFVGGSAEMSRYAAGATIKTDSRTALEFSGPLAVRASVPANHAATLRALLDGGQQPTVIASALAERDRVAMARTRCDADAGRRCPTPPTATTRGRSSWTRSTRPHSRGSCARLSRLVRRTMPRSGCAG